MLVRAELGNVHPYYYVTPDGCVRRRVLEEGEGRGSPNPGAVVCVRVGDGGPARSWSTVVEGGGEEEEWLEEAVLKMKRGELALIETRGGEFGERLDKVHLVEFQEFKNVWELDQEEKLMFAESRKLQGNECYRLGKLERATRRYEQSLDFLQYEQDTWSTDERKERARELKVALFSNLAAIYLAKENVKEVIHYASEALALDPMSVKARFRRAKGYFLGGHSESAIQDVDYLLENCHLDDKVRSSACSIKSLSQKKLRESKSEQLKMFGGIFERRI